MSVCENGVKKSNGIYNSIFCNILKDNCTFVRWCINEQCIKNTDNYIDCRVRSGNMLKTKKDIIDEFESEVIDNSVVENEIEYKEEICKVLWIKEHAYCVDFQGYALSFHTSNEHMLDIEKIKDTIIIKYIGTIGKIDFKYFPVYE